MSFRKVPFVGGPLDGKTHEVPLDRGRHLPHEVVYEHHEPYIIDPENPFPPRLPERYHYFVKPVAQNMQGYGTEEYPTYLHGPEPEEGSYNLIKLYRLAKRCWSEGIFP